jgi:hypothetical protein
MIYQSWGQDANKKLILPLRRDNDREKVEATFLIAG